MNLAVIRRNNRQVSWVAIAALAFLASPVAQAALSLADLKGTWLIEDIDRRGVIDNAHLTLDFTQPGRISGFSGCNRYSGAFTVTGQKVKVGPLISTRMMCTPALMDLEDRLLKSLQQAKKLRFSTDEALILTGGKTHSLTLRQQTVAAPEASDYRGISPGPAEVFRCGEDTLHIALEAGAAYVTLNDGSERVLKRQSQGPQTATDTITYTDGRLTLFQDANQPSLLRRAWGRMAAQECQRIQP